MVLYALSPNAFACEFLTLMGLHGNPQSFAMIVLNSAKSSLFLSTITLLGKGCLVNQATA